MKHAFHILIGAAFTASNLFGITVEVGDGESEAVKIAAENLRCDIDAVCPNHAKDARKIVVKTVGKGGWESSRRTYANGTWTVAGADRRGTVYGIYAISRELGVSPFYWMDDIPLPRRDRFDLSTKTVEIASPAVKYRGIFINDEGWCLRHWAVHNFEKDGTQSLGVKSYEKIFEMMLRCRLNVIWPAMHPGGYEFVSRPENMELADKMGIVIGTSHCEPMLRNNIYWDKNTQGEWNYATNKGEIDKYWQWAVDRYAKQEILWTIGIRGTHDAPMAGNTLDEKVATMGRVFDTQLTMLAKAGIKNPAMNFIPYKEVLPIYDGGLEVPKSASIMWVDDNFGYIRRLGGPNAAEHTGGMYWHVSYFGGPHSFTHVCTTSPGFLWYELGAKCIDNNAKETWILNVGDIKPADILVDAFAKTAWSPRDYGPNAQTKMLVEWTCEFLGEPTSVDAPEKRSALRREDLPKANPKGAQASARDDPSAPLARRIVRHMDNYYHLGTIRKPELMAKQWVDKLTDAEKQSLMKQYVALEKEDIAIEATLPESHRDAWYDAFGFQARFMAAAGRYFLSPDYMEESGKARVQSEINALGKRYDEIFGGKWKDFWYDTFPARGWDNTENGWAAQMQWPWKEPKKDRHYDATQGSDGIAEMDWIDAASFASSEAANGGEWKRVRGLGVSNRAMALLPVKEGVGKDAALSYEIDWKGGDFAELVLQFLPDYRLYPGMRLRVEVSANGLAPQVVEVPFSDGTMDENSHGRSMAVQDNFCRAFVPLCGIRPGKNVVRVHALDAGVVLDRLALRNAPEKLTHPFEKAELRGSAGKTFYNVGEPITFRLWLDDVYDIPEGKYSIKWGMFDDDGKHSEGREPLPLAKPIVLTDMLGKPGFVRVSAEVVDEGGKAVRTTLKRNHDRIFFEGGAGADVDKIKSVVPVPDDFGEYWMKEKKRLAAVPVEVLEKKPCDTDRKDVDIFAVKVRCAPRRTKPASARIPDVDYVTGYLVVPKDHSKKYPARVEFQGYGVHYQETPRWFDGNIITFFVNAHATELGRERAYYDELRRSLLHTKDSSGRDWEYGLNPEENASPDTSYFNGMVMRVIRAFEYVKSLPEWDGKALVSCGGSQGGLQSIWGAALDPDVTMLDCHIPWCCDMGPEKSGRIRQTWGAPWAKGLAYFDAAHFAPMIKSPKKVQITRAALGDELCPPAGVAAFYNALPCNKSIKWVQGSTHGYVPQSLREEFTNKNKE